MVSIVDKKLEQINLKVTIGMKRRLEEVATFEGIGVPELIRSLIREELRTYKIPKRWKEAKKEL